MTSIDEFVVDVSNDTNKFDKRYMELVKEMSDMYPVEKDDKKTDKKPDTTPSNMNRHQSDGVCRDSVYSRIYGILRIIIMILIISLVVVGFYNILKKTGCLDRSRTRSGD